MFKSIFVLFICLFVFKAALAQKKDTDVYFVKNSGKLVSTKDSADYIMLVIPADTSIDKGLFIVKGYYLTGKIKFITGSFSNTFIKYQGNFIGFFPNGRKQTFKRFENGNIMGDEIEYYPNGHLYKKMNYINSARRLLIDCLDSTGNVLTEKGNGKWVNYDKDFKKIYNEGQVNNGMEEGRWDGRINDSTTNVFFYKNGLIVSSFEINKSDTTYTNLAMKPEYPKGLSKLDEFKRKNVKYPEAEKKTGIRGDVFVLFTVDKDGKLRNFRIQESLGKNFDDEAIRVMKLSSPWKPGIQNGKPVCAIGGSLVWFVLKK